MITADPAAIAGASPEGRLDTCQTASMQSRRGMPSEPRGVTCWASDASSNGVDSQPPALPPGGPASALKSERFEGFTIRLPPAPALYSTLPTLKSPAHPSASTFDCATASQNSVPARAENMRFWCLSPPARPHKSLIQNRSTRENANGA